MKTDFWRPHENHQQVLVLIVVDVDMVLLKRQRAKKERSDVEGAKHRGEVDEVRVEYKVEVKVMNGPREERDEETAIAEWLRETVLAGKSRR